MSGTDAVVGTTPSDAATPGSGTAQAGPADAGTPGGATPDVAAPDAGTPGPAGQDTVPAVREAAPAGLPAGRSTWGVWWRRLVRWGLISGSTLWLVFTVAHQLVSGRVWWWRPADLLPPLAFLVVPVVLAVAAAWCGRSRRPVALLSAGALLVGGNLTGLNLAGPLRDTGPVPADAVRVVSWNTEFWHQFDRADEFYDLLRADRADIYLLQEYVHVEDSAPVPVGDPARLRAELPGYHVAVSGEILTLSAYPIVDQYPLAAPGLPPPDTGFTDYWRHKVLRTDLRVGDRVLSVYNVHLPVPLWIGGPDLFSRQFLESLRHQHAQRGPHLRALSKDVAANPNPVLVAGDMNISPAMGERRDLPAGLRDAAGAHRSLYPVSWSADGRYPAWWRLDWALVSPGMTVHRYGFRDPAGQSDHRLQYLAVSW